MPDQAAQDIALPKAGNRFSKKPSVISGDAPPT
jgi:hypothetical protein